VIIELRLAFDAEIDAARDHIRTGKLDRAMTHLERAHVLGQYHVVPHVRAHWWMLRVALQRRRFDDACGQAARIILGAIGSIMGGLPRGNTGSSDVSMFAPMRVDPQLAALVERDLAARRQRSRR